ncbi:putative iron-dependent peroxidase [Alteromonas sp. 76-1]|jgi:putative iron-dependent peroxidase|uniref:Dyp-type peroxidase n=1 Tax=unclassified Alteromonas TaxID=2614992 RepID=UPI000FD17E18|nr:MULTISPECIES: Dyp-type peroxidase [unclassified Alteromonas]MBO7923196.1 Dyp-type peroxidase [Alteromonas sp. K632G]VEL95447.1 putative iron-dependent peroxidase [Alteromonas sp. 76-1]|tara:strand:+ start:6743 stop:7672 length:930 start_codon:yes stop_codon:yes gene_type:complete
MTQPQKGICAEPNLHAQYLLLNVIDDDSEAVRAKLARVLDIFEHFESEHYEAMVTGVVAIGTGYWTEVYPGLIPVELMPFPDMQCEDRSAPTMPCDLFIQIRADRLDICHAIGIEVMDLLRLHVEMVEQIRGFRYLDGRDLTGYLYAADNPRGMKRREVAIVNENDPDFSGGSYLHVQRYKHDLRRWHSLSSRQQEQVMGTTQQHNLVSAEQSESSHSVRANIITTESGKAGLIKQGMPYGDMVSQGLLFVSCSASARPFKAMLHSQIYGNGDGDYDRWLDFTNAETGAAFFAPSVTFIREQAKNIESE